MFKNPTEFVPSTVQLLNVPLVGVPKIGVTNVGDVAKATTVPVPVVVNETSPLPKEHTEYIMNRFMVVS